MLDIRQCNAMLLDNATFRAAIKYLLVICLKYCFISCRELIIYWTTKRFGRHKRYIYIRESQTERERERAGGRVEGSPCHRAGKE